MTGPWRIVDVDLDEPLTPLTLGADEDGLALILRRRGRPVGFTLQPMPHGGTLTPEAIANLAAQEAGASIAADAIQHGLVAPKAQPAAWPSLTIAICTRDRVALLERCLASLDRLLPPDPALPEFEILVVDNAPSDDATRRAVEGRVGVRYVRELRPGLDFARNRAVAAARGELLAFLDDDVVVEPGWLRALLEAWAENPDAGGFTGQVFPFELATAAQVLFELRGGFRRGFAKMRWGRDLSDGGWLHPCNAGNFGAGCNMIFRSALLRQLGGFDEALDTGPPLPGGGDLDIFYRVIRAGRPLVYEPGMIVRHEHRREMAELRRQYWSWGLGFMAFVAKCYRIDPEIRSRQVWMILWWFRDELRQIALSLIGRHVLPPSFLLAELWGGISGILGGYERSRRRVAQLREVLA